ncbi:MAG TPA: iron-containing alcohol dehydrogenase [Geminicoccaceae bacterium]|nr:iron-containing alcohol dehydrogenase [Geminicoccaceae bacterium]
MANGSVIEDLIAGRWRDPTTGRPVRIGTRAIVIERSLDGGEAGLIAPLARGRRLAVVSDRNTYDALGRRVARALARIAAIDDVVLDVPCADLAAVDRLRARTAAAEALIAVGSGTLNDLCKYLAHQSGRSYAVFATAPSMNGYLTATASLARGGMKVSLPARPPVGAFFDLDVLRTAPARLIRAGIGDAICRTTAQTDWLLGHYLRDTPYSEAPYLLQIEDEPCLLSHAAAIVAGDPEGISALTRLLVLAGLGMVMVGGSQPASMGEHLISHSIDMMARPHPGSLHGEQVGVATLTVSRMQHALLPAERPPQVRPTRLDERAMRARYGAPLGDQLLARFRAKALDETTAGQMNARLAEVWPSMRARLQEVMLPTARLREALQAPGAPTTGAELGVPPGFYREAVRHAREIRDRYSILDLAGDAGLLEDFTAEEG